MASSIGAVRANQRPRRRGPSSQAGDDLRYRFARNVRLLRHKKGMTQEQLASAAGIGRSFVNQLERGHFSATLETVGALASALDVSPSTLILGELDEAPGPSG